MDICRPVKKKNPAKTTVPSRRVKQKRPIPAREKIKTGASAREKQKLPPYPGTYYMEKKRPVPTLNTIHSALNTLVHIFQTSTTEYITAGYVVPRTWHAVQSCTVPSNTIDHEH